MTETETSKPEQGKGTARKRKPRAMRKAIIGLLGSLLTVCGGLFGAAISAATLIYQAERQMEQVVVEAPESRNALSLDAGSIAISRQEAEALDPAEYSVVLDQGFAIHRPLPGWGELEVLTMEESMRGEGSLITPEPEIGEEPIYRIRYGEPIEIQYDSQTLINGFPLSDLTVETNRQIYGPEPWVQATYSQVVINVFAKSVWEEMGITSLPDLLVTLRRYGGFGGHISRLIAREGSDFIVVQSTAIWDNVRMAGEWTTFSREAWSLLAEGEDAYYVVEITYIPQSGHSTQVWDDLQQYVDTFRVVR